MKDQRRNSHLSELPLELVIIILKKLPDFDSLFAATRTCRRLYKCFRSNDVRIITSISSNIHQRAIQLDNQAEPFPYQGSCLIILQLIFAIKNRSIKRDFVLHIFKNAWDFLFDKGLEEVLIPLGKELAWSLELENHRQNAISLLDQILSRQPPFKLSSTKLPRKAGIRRPERYAARAPAFTPLESLILRFGQETEMYLPEEVVSKVKRSIYLKQEQLQRLPVALITDDGMLFFHSIIHPPEGFYSESSITLVRLNNPPRP